LFSFVKVLSVSIDEENIVSYIQNTLANAELAYKMSARCNLPGADQLFLARFAQLFQSGNFGEAAKVAATAPRVKSIDLKRIFNVKNDRLGHTSYTTNDSTISNCSTSTESTITITSIF
jgi:hypothetical protein